MGEAELYERIGRMQIQTELQDAAYSKLLNILAAVVSGTVEPSRVLVNLTDRKWEMAAAGQRPNLPPTVNGLPVCVVAPAAPAAAE